MPNQENNSNAAYCTQGEGLRRGRAKARKALQIRLMLRERTSVCGPSTVFERQGWPMPHTSKGDESLAEQATMKSLDVLCMDLVQQRLLTSCERVWTLYNAMWDYTTLISFPISPTWITVFFALNYGVSLAAVSWLLNAILTMSVEPQCITIALEIRSYYDLNNGNDHFLWISNAKVYWCTMKEKEKYKTNRGC